jgi:hypothetical protein
MEIFEEERIMEVLKITENKDGSANVDLSMTEEENNMLIQYAVTNILKEQIKKMEAKDECSCKPGNCSC